jgi:bacterial/archaeal transporter family protein
MFVLRLLGGGLHVFFIAEGSFRGRGSRSGSGATVVTDAVHGGVVDDDRFVVSVVDDRGVDIGNGAVVSKYAVLPTAAFEAHAAVTETVVDAAVEADVLSPIAAVPAVKATFKTPVAGRPEKSWRGRGHPSSRNPVIVVVAVSPVAGRPDVASFRTNGLHVNRQGRRRYVNGNAYANTNFLRKRRRGNRERQECKKYQTQATKSRHCGEPFLLMIVILDCEVKPSRMRKSCGLVGSSMGARTQRGKTILRAGWRKGEERLAKRFAKLYNPGAQLVTTFAEDNLKAWYGYAVLTVLTWGLWGVFSKLASNYAKPKQALLFQTAGVLAFAMVVLFLEKFRIEWSLPGFSWAFLGGFFAFIGFLTFFAALDQGKASTVVTLSALYPLVTILLSIAFLHEKLTMRQGVGIVFALIASALLAV